MEVKINHEIREYTESMFFGLSIRQFFFSLLAVITAAVLYFALEDKVGTELVSWICIAGAVPFAAMGYVKYHGMNCEQLVWKWLRCKVIEPRQYKVRIANLYEAATEDGRRKRQREAAEEEHRATGRQKKLDRKRKKSAQQGGQKSTSAKSKAEGGLSA